MPGAHRGTPFEVETSVHDSARQGHTLDWSVVSRHCFVTLNDWRLPHRCRDTWLKQNVPIPGATFRRAGGRWCETVGGITRGTLLAVLNAPASGRHDKPNMFWGRSARQQVVGETAMTTISSSLICAFCAHHRGSRKDRGSACDAVPASRVALCRFPALRTFRLVERLSLRAVTGRQQRSASFLPFQALVHMGTIPLHPSSRVYSNLTKRQL